MTPKLCAIKISPDLRVSNAAAIAEYPMRTISREGQLSGLQMFCPVGQVFRVHEVTVALHQLDSCSIELAMFMGGIGYFMKLHTDPLSA